MGSPQHDERTQGPQRWWNLLNVDEELSIGGAQRGPQRWWDLNMNEEMLEDPKNGGISSTWPRDVRIPKMVGPSPHG